MKAKVLIVEDEEDIRELIGFHVHKAGYDALFATSGEEAFTLLKENLPDLVLLDLMLPGLSGIELCKLLRGRPDCQDLPILMLTAKGEEEHILEGFEAGADDYLPKPFSYKILLSRVKALLRRLKKVEPEQNPILKIHSIELGLEDYQVRVEGAGVSLTLTEFRLLQCLAKSPGRVWSRDQLITSAHGDDYYVTDRAVDVQVVGLRKKLGEAGAFIQTVRGVGYKMKEEE